MRPLEVSAVPAAPTLLVKAHRREVEASPTLGASVLGVIVIRVAGEP